MPYIDVQSRRSLFTAIMAFVAVLGSACTSVSSDDADCSFSGCSEAAVSDGESGMVPEPEKVSALVLANVDGLRVLWRLTPRWASKPYLSIWPT